MYQINIPAGAQTVIHLLENAGFEAYVVGGCVRDSLLGLAPHDWDICTSAKPNEMLELCAMHGIKTIETGIKHGTVTVCLPEFEAMYEVTTYRIDGEYSDNRHPDTVEFSTSIQDDLSRRDFTVNAMAYNTHTGLVDPFHGEKDLRRHQICCVGNPVDRFHEDALRIMRALRFSSVYGFAIEEDTAKAIHQLAPYLKNIAVERIQVELNKLLLGKGVLEILLDYSDVMAVIIPEIAPCIGFQQNNPYHEYTVCDHIAHAVANDTGDDLSVKIALLLHDIGKPQCYSEDEWGGHFHGHSVPSHDIADRVMQRLRFDNKTREDVLTLVLYHDSEIAPTHKAVRRWLSKIGESNFRKLLAVKLADIKAHAESTQQPRIDKCLALYGILDEVIAQGHCFSIKDLAIGGKDIRSLGVPEGKLIGDILNHILDKVISGDLPNEVRPQMLDVQQYLSENHFKF